MLASKSLVERVQLISQFGTPGCEESRHCNCLSDMFADSRRRDDASRRRLVLRALPCRRGARQTGLGRREGSLGGHRGTLSPSEPLSGDGGEETVEQNKEAGLRMTGPLTDSSPLTHVNGGASGGCFCGGGIRPIIQSDKHSLPM